MRCLHMRDQSDTWENDPYIYCRGRGQNTAFAVKFLHSLVQPPHDLVFISTII